MAKMFATPWGRPDYEEQIAEGIIRGSTSSHGGYWLNAERWAELRRVLPTFHSFAGEGWLEEDSDWVAVYAVWPELAKPDEAFCVVRSFWTRKDVQGYWLTPQSAVLYEKARPLIDAANLSDQFKVQQALL